MNREVAIASVFYTDISRHSEKTLGQLALEACRGAVEDAGLSIDEVDGLASYPMQGAPMPSNVQGIHSVGIDYVAPALKLPNVRWSCELSRGLIGAAVVEAVSAVSSGMCDVALVWRGMHNPRDWRFGRVEHETVSGPAQFSVPWGLGHTTVRYALPFSRYLAKYGATREDMAPFIVRNRENACKNPAGAFFGKPITSDEYLGGRMIADPIGLLDCDMPVDGCGAFVITTGERARELRHNPAYVVGQTVLGLPHSSSPFVFERLEEMQAAAAGIAKALWKNSGVTQEDITHIHFYDGFSYYLYLWLEGFGFCGEGEAYEALKDEKFTIDGKLPLNTNGGALGMGRLHGMPQLSEAVLQIQERAESRQIRDPSVALVETGGFAHGCSALVLSKDRP